MESTQPREHAIHHIKDRAKAVTNCQPPRQPSLVVFHRHLSRSPKDRSQHTKVTHVRAWAWEIMLEGAIAAEDDGRKPQRCTYLLVLTTTLFFNIGQQEIS